MLELNSKEELIAVIKNLTEKQESFETMINEMNTAKEVGKEEGKEEGKKEEEKEITDEEVDEIDKMLSGS